MISNRQILAILSLILVPMLIVFTAAPDVFADEMETVIQGPQSTKAQETQDTSVTQSASGDGKSSSVDSSRERGSWSYWFKGFVKYLTRTVKSVVTGDAFSSKPNGWVTADSLNVRSDSSGSGQKVGKIAYGSQIEILEKKDGYYRVEHGTVKGWVSSRFVKDIEPEEKPGFFQRFKSWFSFGGDKEKKSSDNVGTVTASGRLNVRSGPGSSHNKVGTLSGGDKVTILKKDGIWYNVKQGDKEGWVHGSYISTGNDAGNKSSLRGPEVLVDVETRTQFSLSNGKMGAYWCGPTSLAQVYEYYGREETTREVAHRTYDFKGGTGTSGEALVADAKKNGFPNAKMRYNVGFDYLENSLKKGNPVIVGTEVNWTNGHYLVVVGLKGDKVILNDPARPFFGRREVTRSWFLTQWNGRWRRAITLK